MNNKYIVNDIEYSNIEDIPYQELMDSDGITTIEHLTKEEILNRYRHLLTEEQIKFVNNV